MNWKCYDGIKRDVFREVVTEVFCGHITASRIEEPTEEELNAVFNNKPKPCTHEFVYDERGYLYDTRSCAVCGAGRGTV